MKKSLLVLTDALPPAFAPRMAFLLDALSQKGYKITAFSIRQPGCCNLSTGNAIAHKFDYNPSFLRAIKLVAEACLGYKDRWFYHQIKPYIQGKAFDAVLCSTYDTFPLPTALKIAKQLHIPLIADLRDITEQFGTHYFKNRHPRAPWLGKWFASIKLNVRNNVIKQAQAVVSVSPWHVQFLREKVLDRVSGTSTGSVTDTKPNIHLIYNGYDAIKFHFKPISSNKFNIVYTGRLVDLAIQDPTLLFKALDQCLACQSLKKEDINLHFYTDNDSKQRIQQTLLPHPLLHPLIHYHNMVPAQQVPTLLWESSVVLVLSNKQTTDGPKGIMTTKFFEALGVEKPVLCVKSDEACLASAIAKTNAGIAATHVEEVKAFILEKYAQWQQNGYTHQNVVVAEKEKFSRQSMAQQFENAILSVL